MVAQLQPNPQSHNLESANSLRCLAHQMAVQWEKSYRLVVLDLHPVKVCDLLMASQWAVLEHVVGLRSMRELVLETAWYVLLMFLAMLRKPANFRSSTQVQPWKDLHR